MKYGEKTCLTVRGEHIIAGREEETAMKRILSGQTGAALGAVVVNIMWGLSFIASRHCMESGMQPFFLITVRFLTASLFLIPASLLSGERLKITRRDVPGLLLSAVLGVTVYFWFELNGLKGCSSATASLIIALIPVLTLLWDVLFKKKRPSAVNWIGCAVSAAGVYMVVSSGNEQDTAKGILFMLGACLCWVLYSQITDRLLARLPCLTVTCWQSVFSLFTLVPFCFTEQVAVKSLSVSAWLYACLFLGVGCSAVCYILYNRSIALLSPAKTAIFLNLNPVAAMAGGALLLGDRVTWLQIAGGAVILVSLFFVTRAGKEKSGGDRGRAPAGP